MTSQLIYMKNTKIISVTWEKVSASIHGKDIIRNCSGYCKSGEMVAIMGPSGAGKTTLLSLLSKRQSSSMYIEGEVLANNESFDSKMFFKFGAFVYQNDLLFECLTVQQTLEFAALLKIPHRDAALKKAITLIEEFQLQKCAKTYVGGILVKGISGGQKKRLCVAIQMVSDPALIILDEPTSGLDSNKAAKLLSILKNLANNNHTIIFTIHQPSYLQYIKLDRLVLLDRGETIYQGPAGKISDYMSSLGIRVNQTSTISDFFMMEISQYKKDKSNYETPFNSKNYGLKLGDQIQRGVAQIKKKQLDLALFEKIYLSSFLFSFKMIFARDVMNMLRGGWKIKVTIMQTIVKILLLGLFFLDEVPSHESLNDPFTVTMRLFINAQNVAFNTAGGCIIPSLISVALTIPVERELYYKETDSKKYNPLPYFLSKVIVQFLLVLLGTAVFTSVAYWLTGFTHTLPHFLNFFLIAITCCIAGSSLGFFCSTLFKSMERVSTLTNIVLIPLLILSGVFNKFTSMPVWSAWLQYLSPFRYGTHLFLQNEYGDEIFTGAGGEYDYRSDLGVNLSYINNFLVLLGLSLGCYITSFILLKYYATKIAP